MCPNIDDFIVTFAVRNNTAAITASRRSATSFSASSITTDFSFGTTMSSIPMETPASVACSKPRALSLSKNFNCLRVTSGAVALPDDVAQRRLVGRAVDKTKFRRPDFVKNHTPDRGLK